MRDRAAENHPIIGIAALGSAIIQISPRDAWIGWDPKVFPAKLMEKPSVRDARWVEQSLTSFIDAIYVGDFVAEGLMKPGDLTEPRAEVIERLQEDASKSAQRHKLYPKTDLHKAPVAGSATEKWVERAESYLFRSKRARTLAQLLSARAALTGMGFSPGSARSLVEALGTQEGRRAIRTILRQVKGRHVGVDMLDITVCGAVAPYGPVLGGKLVAMLLTSPEVVRAYEVRYEAAPSIIASSMAGREVCRAPKLVLLGTTSLYGASLNQYTRVSIPAEAVGGQPGLSVRYRQLGSTEGFGSFHLSADTVREIEVLLAREQQSRRVNSIFGEGVNPRLRKIRSGLDHLGFPSGQILRHGNQRVVYGVALASNFRDVLLGRAKTPKYILPMGDAEHRTQLIADYWMERWLSKRIEKDDVLDAVEQHTLARPITHGARVILPDVEEENPLFPGLT